MFEKNDNHEDDEKVVNLIKRRALAALIPPQPEEYVPSDSDMEIFLLVLDYIRKMSISETGSIKFNDEFLTVEVDHLVDWNEDTDSTLSLVSRVHSDFHWDSVDGLHENDILLTEIATEFWNALQEITQDTEEENEKDI